MTRTKRKLESLTDWRAIENEREKYAAYLCSREWGVLEEAVHKRSGGTCERCGILPGNAVHHLTHERKYREEIEDLQHNCHACHDFTHGKSEFDPVGYTRTEASWPDMVCSRAWTRYVNSCLYFGRTPVNSAFAFFGWSSETRTSLLHQSSLACGLFAMVDAIWSPLSQLSIDMSDDEDEDASVCIAESLEQAIDAFCSTCGFEDEVGLWVRMRCPTIDYNLHDESIRQVRKCLPPTPKTRR